MKRNSDKKILILIRHAHRDTSDPGADNGLSPKGWDQAKGLLTHYKRVFKKKEKPTLVSSPKQRCLETLELIAEETGCPLERLELLVEQKPGESHNALRSRVQKFCDAWLKGSQSLTLACSHGDWLPIATEILTGGQVDFGKGGWAQIEIQEGKPVLTVLIQRFDSEGMPVAK